jgi:hypothetical protein
MEPMLKNARDDWSQGAKTGRIFAYWVVVFLRKFFLIRKAGKNFGAIFSTVHFVHLYFTKHGLGYISDSKPHFSF